MITYIVTESISSGVGDWSCFPCIGCCFDSAFTEIGCIDLNRICPVQRRLKLFVFSSDTPEMSVISTVGPVLAMRSPCWFIATFHSLTTDPYALTFFIWYCWVNALQQLRSSPELMNRSQMVKRDCSCSCDSIHIALGEWTTDISKFLSASHPTYNVNIQWLHFLGETSHPGRRPSIALHTNPYLPEYITIST